MASASRADVCEKTTRSKKGVWLIHRGQGRFIRTVLHSSGTIQPSIVQGHLDLSIRGYWCLSRDGNSRLKVRGLEWIKAGDVFKLVFVPFRFLGHPPQQAIDHYELSSTWSRERLSETAYMVSHQATDLRTQIRYRSTKSRKDESGKKAVLEAI